MLPVMKKRCPTCPFRKNGYTEVREFLSDRALFEGTPICHSTGDSEIVDKVIHKKPHACRGARDLQLQMFHRIGWLKAPTDAAWNKKIKELGL